MIQLKTFIRSQMGNLFMIKYKVVLVPFPFDDLSSSKVRPAVCLTDPIGPHRHVVLAFITSRIPASPLSTDFIIDSKDKAFSLTDGRLCVCWAVPELV